MPSLPELQHNFASDLLGESAHHSGDYISDGKFPRERLLQVYRNNYLLSLTKALRDIHPIVNKLVGDDFFNFSADRYIRRHPSTSGNLHHFGEHFASFLAAFEPAAKLPYLSDIAQLDWACHCAFHAATAVPIPQQKLSQVPTEHYGELYFALAPAVSLLQSDYPIFSIWSFGSQGEGIDAIGLEINSGGECALVHRPALEVSVTRLDRAEFAFLNALGDEQTLSFAVEQAVDQDATFDLNAALSRFLSNATLTDLWLHQKAVE